MLNKIPYLKKFSKESQKFLLTLTIQEVLRYSNFIWLIYANFLLSKNISLFEISILLNVWTFTILLSDIPTGVLADIWGRRKCIIIGRVLWFLSISLLAFFPSFIVAAITLFFWGLSSSLDSGAYEAIIYDRLKELKEESKFSLAFTYLSSIKNLTMGFGAILAGVVSDISLDKAMYGSVILAFLYLISVVQIPDPIHSYKNEKLTFLKSAKEAVRFSITNKKIFFIIIFSVFVLAAYFSTEEFYTIGLEKVGFTFSQIGLIALADSLCYLIGGFLYTHTKIINQSIKRVLIISSLLFGICLFLLTFKSVFFLPLGYLLARVLLGINQSYGMNIVQKETSSHIRASVTSILNFGMNASLGIITLMIGIVMNKGKYFEAFYIPAAITSLFVIFALIYLRNKDKDKILG